MSTGPAVHPRIRDLAPTAANFRAELIAGLRRRPRRLPSKFFYDARGSELFDRICELPEYYPTRTELGILEHNQARIREFCGPDCRLVELGSGNSRKTRRLLGYLDAPAAYVPIDISREHLQHAASALAAEFPALEILPICADYSQSIPLPDSAVRSRRTVIFFPGSTLGNFEHPEAVAFLRHIATWCRPGDRMIIGIDLEKSRDELERAYNDSRGLTAAFNLNLLVRANRELGADFVIDQFSHRAVYNAPHGRIEMRLASTCDQRVTVGPEPFDFRAGEEVVTEFSYKYRPERFAALVNDAGWTVAHRWSDSRAWFGVFGLEWGLPLP